MNEKIGEEINEMERGEFHAMISLRLVYLIIFRFGESSIFYGQMVIWDPKAPSKWEKF